MIWKGEGYGKEKDVERKRIWERRRMKKEDLKKRRIRRRG